MATQGVVRNLSRGEVLFRQGDRANLAYLIESGWVKILISAAGGEALIDVAGPSDLIGEMSLADGGLRSATVKALVPCTLYVISHSALRSHSRIDPDFILRLIATRLRRSNKLMAELKNTDVPARLARRLIDLADNYGTVSGRGVAIRVPLTQEELGQMVGASRERVNKVLAMFESQGWLAAEGRHYLILNSSALKRRSS